MTQLCYINGVIMPVENGSIGIRDLAIQRGYGVFDYGRTYNRKLFHFEENIRRFRESASELHLTPPVTDEEILEIAQKLIDGSDLSIPAVRLLLTGGYSATLEEPNFIMIAEELATYPDELFEHGAKIVTVEFQRELPYIKSINYLNAIRLEPLKKARNAFDILYHSHHGITECPRNNFLAFIGDTLVTPSEHVLHGVTRSVVLELAASKFRIEERRMDFDEISSFDEAFVTSTSKAVMPVTTIDDEPVGDGKVGKRTKTLMGLFEDYTREF